MVHGHGGTLSAPDRPGERIPDGDPLGQLDDVARHEQLLEPLDGGLPVGVAGGGEQRLLAVSGDVLDRPGAAVVGSRTGSMVTSP
jgi:hypothetical protein